jgi:hypothetical protein
MTAVHRALGSSYIFFIVATTRKYFVGNFIQCYQDGSFW